jgi:hypothetical protein
VPPAGFIGRCSNISWASKNAARSFPSKPCIPRDWREFKIEYRYGKSVYEITVENPHGASGGVAKIEIDGKRTEKNKLELVDNGQTTRVRVILGKPEAPKVEKEFYENRGIEQRRVP